MQTYSFISISLFLALIAAGCAPKNGPGSPAMSAAREAQICLNLARDFDAKGYANEAIGEYQRARGKDPSLKGIAKRLAVLYDRSGNDSLALQEYKNAQREAPFDPEVLNDFGFFYIVRNDGDDAEPWFRLALAQDPKSERAWVNLGTALAEQGKDSQAYGAFARVLPPARAWSNLGMIQVQQGRYKAALLSLKKANEADPNLVQTQAMLKALSAEHAP